MAARQPGGQAVRQSGSHQAAARQPPGSRQAAARQPGSQAV